MEKEITIENLSQEVTDLKIKIEALEAENKELIKKHEDEKGLHRLYDGLYTEKAAKVTQLTEFIRTLEFMLQAAMDEECDRASEARLELIAKTIRIFKDESKQIA